MINQDLQEIRNTVDQTRQILAEAIVHEQDEKYKPFLIEQIEGLQKALSNAQTPEHYKVAIVGRFKVGKSSFVNAFCDTKNLASVKTTPETAAITIFRYSDKVHAEIQMISKDRWDKMVETYQTNPSDSVTRYQNLLKDLENLGKSNADSKNKSPTVALAELEKEYISNPSVIKQLECVDWNDKGARKEFTTQVQKFMSKGNLAHYFVDKVIVYVPVPLLQEGIELIDTPGLEDPDTYRVNLTNESVKEADVILYLMHSGHSYAQSDKDFIIEQLRRHALKHLRLIVTKCDSTFDSAKRDAKDKEEQEPSFDEHIADEKTRLRLLLNTTLDELLIEQGVGEDEKMFFLEQLVDIPISFISSTYYDDGGKPESGIDKLRKDLGIMLAKSERISQARKILQEANDRIFERTQRTFSERLEAIGQKFNVEQVKLQLQQIDAEIRKTLDDFEKTVKQQVEVFKSRNKTDWESVDNMITNIVSEAEKVIITGHEKTDWRAHWKTRRHGSWGNIEQIAKQIANHIFPQVETILRRYRSHFENDVLSHIKTDLEKRQQVVAQIEQNHNASTSQSPLKLTEIFEKKYQSVLRDVEDDVNTQKNAIGTHLDEDFVSSMKPILDGFKKSVTAIRGRGTTAKQDEEIEIFYQRFRSALKPELKTCLIQRFKKFSSLLEDKSETILSQLREELRSVVDARRKAIEASLVQRNETEKAQLIEYLTTYLNKLKEIQSGQVTL
jgi:predicted GTPase